MRWEGGNACQRQRGEYAVGTKPLGLETDVDAQEATHVGQTDHLLRVRPDRVTLVVQEDESGKK